MRPDISIFFFLAFCNFSCHLALKNTFARAFEMFQTFFLDFNFFFFRFCNSFFILFLFPIHFYFLFYLQFIFIFYLKIQLFYH